MYYIFRVKSPINLSLKNLAAFCEFVARCNITAAAAVTTMMVAAICVPVCMCVVFLVKPVVAT